MKAQVRRVTAWVEVSLLCFALIFGLTPAQAHASLQRCCEDRTPAPHVRAQTAAERRATEVRTSRMTKLIDALVLPLTRLPEDSHGASTAAGEWWSDRSRLEKSLIVGAAAAAVAVGVFVLSSRLDDPEKEPEARYAPKACPGGPLAHRLASPMALQASLVRGVVSSSPFSPSAPFTRARRVVHRPAPSGFTAGELDSDHRRHGSTTPGTVRKLP